MTQNPRAGTALASVPGANFLSTLTNRVMRSRYRDELSDKVQRLASIISQSREEGIMLRKTIITLVSVAALGLGSAAMAAHGGGGGGGGGFGGGGGGGHGGGGASFGGGAAFGAGGGSFGRGGSFGGAGVAATPRGGTGPMMMQGGNMGPIRGGLMATAPMNGGRIQGWNGRTAWANNRFHDHFHNRFRNRNFFAFGFGGPIYDYAYDSCWSQVPTRYGWQWVYVCGDYGY